MSDAAGKIAELGWLVVIVCESDRWPRAMDVEIQYECDEWDAVHAFEKFPDTEWVSEGYPPDWEEGGDEVPRRWKLLGER